MKTLKTLVVIFSAITVFLACCFSMLKISYNAQNAVLQNKWRSEETGQVLTFTNDNQVKFENSDETGTYYIRTATKMEYSVDGKCFQMVYHIQDNKLYWGLDPDTLECFSKI